MEQEEEEFTLGWGQWFELIFAVLVLVAALAYSVSVGTDMRIMKEKSARDMALTVETMVGSPGSVLFGYADSFGFQYQFRPNRVDVYSRDEQTFNPASTYYIFPQDSEMRFLFPATILGPNGGEKTVVSLKKNFDSFTFGQEDLTFSSSSCEKITVPKSPVLILRSSADPKLKELIEKNLMPALRTIGVDATPYDDLGALKSALSGNKDTVMLEISTLAVGQDDSNKNTIRILANPDKKARRISCIIKNKLQESNLYSTSLADSSPDFVTPVSLKIEISADLPYETVIGKIADSLKEYFPK